MTRPMIDDNGIIRPMTDDELKEYEQQATQLSPPEPTPEERIAALEEQLRAAKILLGVE